MGTAFICILAPACRDAETPKQAAIGTFNLGEKVQVGPLIYTVFETKWEIGLGDQAVPRVPTNRFFIVRLSVVNGGTQPVSIPTISLVDDSGQVYQELDNGEGVKDWMGFVRRVRPAESAEGTIVFDVPQKRFQMRVADEEDHFALVNIPLSLGSAPAEAPSKAGK